MVRTRLARTAALIGAAATATLGLTGCAGATAAPDGVTIVATTTQVGDFTRALVGEQAEVTQLLAAGQSAHAFDPSAAQLAALANADALVISGAGLESWIDDAIDASGFEGLLIDAGEGVVTHGTHEHDGDEDHDHGGGGGHDDGHDDDHDHAGGNPHIWTDPALAEVMVRTIADGLAEIDGLDSGELEASASAYEAKLVALDDWITENIEMVPVDDRLLVTNHDAFTYFVEAYGITFVGSVIPNFDDNAEPSAAEIDELIARIAETGATAVFAEGSISPKAAETIAREAGIDVYSGDDALYADSLGAPGSEGATYLGSQIHNVRLILASWGATPSPLPAALEG